MNGNYSTLNINPNARCNLEVFFGIEINGTFCRVYLTVGTSTLRLAEPWYRYNSMVSCEHPSIDIMAHTLRNLKRKHLQAC